MTSEIDPTTIDEEFPRAGRDNASQGFRDNFSIIKTNLQTASNEITTLQTNVAFKNTDNNFFGNKIIDAELQQVTDLYYSSVLEENYTIRFFDGHYQEFTVSGDIILNFSDWPEDNRMGKVRVALRGDDTARTATWNILNLKTNSQNWSSNQYNLNSSTQTLIFDFWTTDNGDTVYGHYLGVFQ